jgi:hypothetical protein
MATLRDDGHPHRRVSELLEQGSRDDAVHVLHDLLFDLGRGVRTLTYAELCSLAQTACELGLWSEGAQLARHTLACTQPPPDPDRTVEARIVLLGALYQQQQFGEAYKEVAAGEDPPTGASPGNRFVLHLNEGLVPRE